MRVVGPRVVGAILAIVGGSTGLTVEFDRNAEAEWSSAGSWGSNSLPCAGDPVSISAAPIDVSTSLRLTVDSIPSSAAQRFAQGIDFDAQRDTFIVFEGDDGDGGASLIFFDDGPGCGGSSGDSVSTPMPTTMSTATTGTLACIDGPDCTGFSRAQCGTFIFNGHFNGPQNVSSLCRGLCDTCGAGDRAPAAADDEDDGGDTDVDASKAAADNADDDTAGSGATVGFVVLFVIFALTMEMLLYNLDMSSTRDESVTASFMGKDEHWKRAFQPTAPSEGSPQAQSEYEGGDPATADFRQPTDLAMGDVGRGVDNMMYAASPGTVASTTFAIDSMSPAGDLGLGSQAPPPADPCSSSPPQHATLTNDGFELEV